MNFKSLTGMYCNVGSRDKLLRIIIGVITLFVLATVFETYWLLVGWVLIATGLLEFCPVYYLFGFSTSKEKKKFWA
jgi:uncharacterized membrane protein HdeD (DUF308 family)